MGTKLPLNLCVRDVNSQLFFLGAREDTRDSADNYDVDTDEEVFTEETGELFS